MRNFAWVEVIDESNKYFDLTPSNKLNILIKRIDAATYKCIT